MLILIILTMSVMVLDFYYHIRKIDKELDKLRNIQIRKYNKDIYRDI